ncbi:MAG TPA: hypothetical protein VKQ36_07185 [Ktedonobacterales bacterium]|nr:hypothetical protein [Ktedonobacterales bacterium]
MYVEQGSLAALRWRALIENAGLERQRLRLGQNIIRNNKIVRAMVAPARIEILVAGSYWDSYAARVEAPAFPDSVWDAAIEALSQDTTTLAHLFSGQLTSQVEAVFDTLGAPLFPATLAEFDSGCSCRNSEQPCKHLIALHYFFADQLQRTPFLIFTFRGRVHDELIKLIRAEWVASQAGSGGDAEQRRRAIERADPQGLTPLRASRFFATDASFEQTPGSPPDIPAAPEMPASLLRRIGRPPFVSPQEDPGAVLAPVYDLASRRAIDALKIAAKARNLQQEKRSTPGQTK